MLIEAPSRDDHDYVASNFIAKHFACVTSGTRGTASQSQPAGHPGNLDPVRRRRTCRSANAAINPPIPAPTIIARILSSLRSKRTHRFPKPYGAGRQRASTRIASDGAAMKPIKCEGHFYLRHQYRSQLLD